MGISAFFNAEFDDHRELVDATRNACAAPFAALVGACVLSLRAGGKLLFFGNGGSAADAQHIATELTVRYTGDRDAIAAIALTTDSSALTAIGNDFGFDRLFSRQIEALGKPGDVAIGISTSGKSANVNLALKTAGDMGLVCVGWTGGDGGGMRDLCDPVLRVPSATTARIQEMHILIGHMLCGAIERELGSVRR